MTNDRLGWEVGERFKETLESKEILYRIVESVERCIDRHYIKFTSENEEPLTLISGLSGCALFYGYAYKKFKTPFLLERTFELVETCIERIGEVEQPSLYQGFTGIAWVIRHLVNIGIFETSSLEVLHEIDEHIEKTIDIYEEHIYYSLMYGLIGHGVYFSEAKRNQTIGSTCAVDTNSILKRIVGILENSAIKTKHGLTWVDNTSLDYHKKQKIIYNLGMPHGIAGVVSFLSEMANSGIEIDKCHYLIKESLSWLLAEKRNFDGISYYPSLLADDEPAKITRLSWAYGDLCSATAFLKGFHCLGERRFLDESYESLIATTKRDASNSIIHVNPEDNQINAGLLKGAGGVILMSKLLNDYFKNEIVDNKINYWINRLLETQVRGKEIGDFKSFFINEKEETRWDVDTGFLEGLSGVGLLFLYLSDNDLKDWQKVMLL